MLDEISFLYKYRSVSGASSVFVERSLKENEIYFSRPSDFNDPFDCAPVPSLQATDVEFSTYLNDLYKRRAPHLSRAARRRSIAEIMADGSRNHRSSKTLEILRQGMIDAVNSAGVLSLSACCDHVLMWSHYADSHRGICLRFKAFSTTPFFGRAQKVRYQKERPILNLIRDLPDTQSEKALLTKADFWSYEEEWRIVEHEKGPGIHKFPEDLLDGVILGARISSEDRRRIVELSNNRPTPPDMFQANIDPNLFRISISPLAPT